MSSTPSSSPAKPSSVTPTGGTPSDVAQATVPETPVEPTGFETEILDLIVSLLAPTTPEASSAIRAGLDHLFYVEWEAKLWADLGVFSAADVANDVKESAGVSSDLKSKVLIKKLGYIIDYAHYGPLTPELTMSEIISMVDTQKSTGKMMTVPSSPSRKSVTVFDKNSVPELDKFSGNDEDYFEWRESTIDRLGAAGCFDFLVDETMASKHPSMSQSVFFSLRGAVRAGHAQSIAQALVDEQRNTPMILWSELESYYNTALNRANVVLYNIRRLLSLRLTADVAPTTFINDFKDCLQRLRKNDARLADDSDTLRALLLVAIQDDDFDGVRDAIVQKPGSDVKDILNEIRERTQSLKMKDHAASPDGETGISRHSRRVQKTSSATGSQPAKTEKSNATKKWNIPRLPDGWLQSLGKPIFRMILDWRTAAHHKGFSQERLNEEFDTYNEKVNNNKRSQPSQDNETAGSGGTKSSTSGDSSSKEPQRKKIRYRKSRRVITERST